MKQASKKNKSRAKASSLLSVHLQRFIRETAFIFSAAVALFFMLALITYHRADPAWSHVTVGNVTQNAAGKVGAWFADFLLYLFGYVAYIFPLMIGYVAYSLYKNQGEKEGFDPSLLGVRTIGILFVLLSGTGIASLYFSHFISNLPFNSGGILGALISRALLDTVNATGGSVLLFSILFLGISLLTGFSWLRFLEVIGGMATEFFGQVPDYFRGMTEFLKKQWQNWRTEKNKLSVNKPLTRASLPERPVIQKAEAQIVPERRVSAEEERVQEQTHRWLKPAKGQNVIPPFSLLDPAIKSKEKGYSTARLEEMSGEVEKCISDFGIDVKVVAVHPGPVITRFELQLSPGQKVSKLTNLVKDLARSLSVMSVRIVEVIPGKSVVGLEIPNENRDIVRLSEIVESKAYEQARSPLSLALGKDIAGHSVVVDLCKMPHLLMAGTTGSGKSVSLNAMVLSLLYKSSPDQVRMIMIDPKMLELSIYEGIPHLLTPVVTDMKDATNALRWCVAEMDRRYRLMAALGVRNLLGYNLKITEAEEKGSPILDPLIPAGSERKPEPLETLPFIVVVIDELADMMMVVGKKVEELIARIAQKARAAGIHLILATQRPSVDVITGLIKANVPTRIAFQVSSKIDSRTILDQQGAEQLLGHGDLLYLPPGSGVPVRVHGAFVSDQEVHNVVNYLKSQGEPCYLDDIINHANVAGSVPFAEMNFDNLAIDSEGEADPLYDQAVQIVVESRRASISGIQRRLKIGFNRAARMIEEMEKAGLVGPMEASGNREILVPPSQRNTEETEEH